VNDGDFRDHATEIPQSPRRSVADKALGLPYRSVNQQRHHQQFIRRLFLAAVKDRIIPTSPAADVLQAKRETPIRDTPTWDQFRAIVADIRSQRLNADAAASGDFCEFMGLSGLGNAEAGGLSKDDMGRH
jgi:hypothetical protein